MLFELGTYLQAITEVVDSVDSSYMDSMVGTVPISINRARTHASVSDPHILYVDPDPAFLGNADPDIGEENNICSEVNYLYIIGR